MIRRNTIIVLVVFLVLLAVVIYINFNPNIQTSMGMITATPTEQPSVIGDFAIKDVVKIKYTDANGNATELSKLDGTKWVTAKNEEVSTAAWFEIFQYTTSLKSLGQLDNNTPLDKIGLSPAQQKITFTDNKGQSSTLLIGSSTASKDSSYIKWNNDPVKIVNSEAITAIANTFSPENLLQPTPTPMLTSDPTPVSK
jgi:hypothetical protein